jgi:hypothetical protein
MEWYVDTNGVIYGTHYRSTALGAGATSAVDMGLKDITVSLPNSTVATIMVDVIKFRVQAVIAPGIVDAYLSIQTGVKPINVLGSGLGQVTDYQDIQGWPLKNGYALVETNVEHPGSSGMLSWSFTYKPKNKLALNRLQDINCCIKAEGGSFVNSLSSIWLQGKRGGT